MSAKKHLPILSRSATTTACQGRVQSGFEDTWPRITRGRLQLVLILLVGLWHQPAHSKPIAEFLGEARTALVEDKSREAMRRLDEAEAAIVEAVAVVPSVHLANFWYLRGLDLQMRQKTNRAMDAWRKALTVDPRFEWDIELMADKDSRRLFEALRGEIRARPEVGVQFPGETSEATLWVDGRRVRPSDVVRAGSHLLQVYCPDAKVYGAFSELTDEQLDWLALCPNGVNTSVTVADTAGIHDEFEHPARE
jgi:tetratricopeptide (TPR) repeat protein